MRSQLAHLTEMVTYQNVTLQVLPFAAGAPAWAGMPFLVLEFPPPAELRVVYLEQLDGGLYLEDAEQIRRYSLMFDHLLAAALAPRESLALVRRMAAQLE